MQLIACFASIKFLESETILYKIYINKWKYYTPLRKSWVSFSSEWLNDLKHLYLLADKELDTLLSWVLRIQNIFTIHKGANITHNILWIKQTSYLVYIFYLFHIYLLYLNRNRKLNKEISNLWFVFVFSESVAISNEINLFNRHNCFCFFSFAGYWQTS